MLRDRAEAFATRKLERALKIIRADSEMDRLRDGIVFSHAEPVYSDAQESLHVLALAQILKAQATTTRTSPKRCVTW